MSARQGHDEDFGNDSFLDVVCNMVGIVIILVMVVGTRAQVTMRPEADGPPPEIVELDSQVTAMTADALRQAGQVDELRSSMAARDMERQRLAQVAALRRREIETARQQLDERARAEFDAQRELTAAQQQIDRLEFQIDQAQPQQAQTVQVVSYPTPISATVDGPEGHFQLRGRRVIHIPLDRLVARLKDDARQKVWKLRNTSQITETIGPLGGFRLVYTLGKYDVPLRDQVNTGQSGSVVMLDEWTLAPTSGTLGESIEQALAPRSEFRAALAQYDPRKTVVTLWVYPDSFSEFRRLKEELHKQGFRSAGRPLPDGVPISGSPEGSKSAAQ